MIFFGLLFMFMIVACIGCEEPKGRVAQEFDSARNALTVGNYPAAITALNRFLNNNAEHDLASRASFLLAKAHLGNNDLVESANCFAATIAKYPASEESHKSRYKLAMLHLLRDDFAAAKPLFEALATSPDGPLAAEAIAWVRYLDAKLAGRMDR